MSLALAASLRVPNGVHAGQTLGDVLTSGDDGVRWLRWAARRHAAPSIREAARELVQALDDPETRAVPAIIIIVPLEGTPRLSIVAPDVRTAARLAAWVAGDAELTALISDALDLEATR